MVRISLIVLFCIMLFIGGCCSNSGCPFEKKECAYNIKAGCCPKELAEKCSQAATYPKAAAVESSKPATCSSQLTEKIESPTVKKRIGCSNDKK